MVKEVTALQGKEFTVVLQSMVGSSGYGWYLSGLPEGIVFLYQENIPVRPGIAPVNQVFHFVAITDQVYSLKINFLLLRAWLPEEPADSCTVNVSIIPHNSESFVPYSENANIGAGNINVKYGYACGLEDANMKYGYRCGAENANLKYGYQCGVENANLKYGYQCGAEAASKAAMPYGYWQGGMNGMPQAVNTNVLYGYWCG